MMLTKCLNTPKVLPLRACCRPARLSRPTYALRTALSKPAGAARYPQQRLLCVSGGEEGPFVNMGNFRNQPDKGGKDEGKGKVPDLNADSADVADALIKTMGEVSKASGRQSQTRNMVMGADGNSQDKWEELDKKVNEYPTKREFRAIGTGGDAFCQAMVKAVEGALGRQVPEKVVTTRPSSKGKYISVNVGPVLVMSSEEVVAVYSAMKLDERLKWFI